MTGADLGMTGADLGMTVAQNSELGTIESGFDHVMLLVFQKRHFPASSFDNHETHPGDYSAH